MSYHFYVQQYAPYILIAALLGLAYYALRYIRDRQDVPTYRIIGMDPVNNDIEFRQVEKEGKHGIWSVENGDDIRFVPKQETRWSTPEGPLWILDLTDGRTLTIPEADEVARTTGQELHKAVLDQTISQSLKTQEADMAYYIRLLVIAAPIIILGLVVIGIGVFAG